MTQFENMTQGGWYDPGWGIVPNLRIVPMWGISPMWVIWPIIPNRRYDAPCRRLRLGVPDFVNGAHTPNMRRAEFTRSDAPLPPRRCPHATTALAAVISPIFALHHIGRLTPGDAEALFPCRSGSDRRHIANMGFRPYCPSNAGSHRGTMGTRSRIEPPPDGVANIAHRCNAGEFQRAIPMRLLAVAAAERLFRGSPIFAL